METGTQNVRYDDVFYTLVPIGYVCQACGLLPAKLTRNKKDHESRKQINFPLLVYGVTVGLALAGAQCWGLYRDLHVAWQNSTNLAEKMKLAVTASDALIAVVLSCFIILGSTSRWKLVLQALHKIVRADEELDFTTTKNLRRSSIILITCTLVYMTYISVADYASLGTRIVTENEEKHPINYCPFYLMQTVIMVLVMQYAIILMNLGERFTKLNRTIEKLTKTSITIGHFRNYTAQEPQRKSRQLRLHVRASSSIEGVTNYKSDTMEPIGQLIKVYDLLCDSIVHLNKAFGFQLVMCAFSCLVHFVVTFYFVYCELQSANSRWYSLTCQIGWLTFHICKMFLFVQPPHTVASKARNTGLLVSQALARDWNPEAQKQLESFAMQLLHRPVEFTACGLFYLDRGLVTSIAGVVTTYLVILVQFRSKSDD